MLSKTTPRWEAIPPESAGAYLIQRELKPTHPLPLDSPVAASFTILRWLLYGICLAQRYKLITTISLSIPALLPAAWLIFIIELSARFGPVLFQADMALYLLFRGDKRAWQRPRLRLVGPAAPTVDVFVTCCGEDIELIMDTVRAAAGQDYQLDKYRVFLLDDARDDELRAAIQKYNVQRPPSAQEIRYLSRAKVEGKPHYFKAGNLRFGIEQSKHMANLGSCSEYIAALDVDAIPQVDWLRRMVPHLVLDGGMAAIVPGLSHYNLPEIDILSQDIATPWDISIEHMRDAMGVTNLYGSGYVMRRAALDSIGGWPLVPSAEDLYCGHLLAGQGWKIAFCWDICQHDLTPASLDALVSQRLRWTEGDLNLAQQFNFFLPVLDPGKQRTLARRATALIGSLRLYKGVIDAVFLLLLTPLLLFTLEPVDMAMVNGLGKTKNSNESAMRAAYLASLIVDKLSSFFSSGLLIGSATSVSWFTPFEALATISFHLRSRTNMQFKPTGTVISTANERTSMSRKPLVKRLLARSMLFYLFYIIAAICCLVTFLARLGSWHHGQASGNLGGLHTSLFTPALIILVESISAMSVPMLYMIWPPSVPERRELLEEDRQGVLRPKEIEACSVAPSSPVPWVGILQFVILLVIDWRLARDI